MLATAEPVFRRTVYRYYAAPDNQDELIGVSKKSISTILACSKLPTDHIFTAAVICSDVIPQTSSGHEELAEIMHSFVQQLPALAVMYADHHHAHAALGFWDSPFQEAFIFSYDGGGRDGHMNTFLGSRAPFQTVARLHNAVPWFLGSLYVAVSSLIVEIVNKRQMDLALPGKAMALESLGRARADLVLAIKGYARQQYHQCEIALKHGRICEVISIKSRAIQDNLFARVHSDDDAERRQNGRDLAASLQRAFEELVVEALDELLPAVKSQYDGLVLTGGCSLNVKANTLIADRYVLIYNQYTGCILMFGHLF